jgi:SAM-dependent methyltransferase
VRAIRATPRYLRDLFTFIVIKKGRSFVFAPALLDFSDSAGSADGHYFWQDLICARWIHKESPKKHLDVGSRIDGFIAHLLIFMDVTLLDIRDSPLRVQGLRFLRGDAQDQLNKYAKQFDSVSSLHSIEHFGLGRYRDSLQIDGHVSGLSNISKCVKPKGVLYVSFPIGKESTEFNSQRILSPNWPQELLSDFTLEEFVLIPWRGIPVYNLNPSEVNTNIKGQAGLYKFRRL